MSSLWGTGIILSQGKHFPVLHFSVFSPIVGILFWDVENILRRLFSMFNEIISIAFLIDDID